MINNEINNIFDYNELAPTIANGYTTAICSETKRILY